MLLNRPKLKFGVSDLLLAAAAILFFIGIRAWFPVCAATEEHVMSCHWAGETLKAVSLLNLVLAVVHFALPEASGKLGMDVALLGLAVLTACVPGRVIGLCQSAEMHCRALTQPWTVAFGIAQCLLALADGACYLSLRARERHHRSKAGG